MWPRPGLHLPPGCPGPDVPGLPGHLPGGSGGQHHRAGGCSHQPSHAGPIQHRIIYQTQIKFNPYKLKIRFKPPEWWILK